jgi:ribosomal protein S18 acetylase RimI-like enzyme
MADLPERLFANPVWHALQTRHRHFAVCAGDACRYPADVAPFAALAAPTKAALQELHSLLAPGESLWLIGERYPQIPEISLEETIKCLQMVLQEQVTPPGPVSDVVQLSDADAPEMVALTDIAFPGFFRIRTCEMGSYYGVRCGGELIAMGGERLMVDGYAEISGICTHSEHRGKGLAASIIGLLARNHRRDGLASWLHVRSENRHAIELYLRLGFKVAREVTVHRMSRRESA